MFLKIAIKIISNKRSRCAKHSGLFLKTYFIRLQTASA